MANDMAYISFAVIGLILVIIGALIIIFSGEVSIAWASFGSGIAIIWVSFHKIYHKK